MSDARNSLARKALGAALIIGIGALLALAPAHAVEGSRGGFGGVQGWGGLYRDNRDVDYFPVFYAYDLAWIAEGAPVRRPRQIQRHIVHHRHAVAHHCPPKRPVRRCVCH